jgi:nitrite reductase/ring-hydroxylating ferredoxin subunit
MFVATGLSPRTLEGERRKVVRKEGKQVLLLWQEGKAFALANRCPHEGYPLSEGTPGPGCVLTCNWHNWKFDLASGAALIGRDPVRIYPIDIRADEIFVDLSDPPAEAQRQRALKGLDMAIADNDLARMAREVARLERAGFPTDEALIHAIRLAAPRFENGMTHAYAAAPDWLTLAARASAPEQHLSATLEPIAHVSWDTLGMGTFPYAEGKTAWDAQAFVTAAEHEDEAAALALVRGAIASRLPYSTLRPALGEAALAHYADFGHSAIYVLKAGQLIARLGDGVAEPVLLALTRSLVQATREERLPEFRHYFDAFAAWDGKGTKPIAAEDLRRLAPAKILDRVVQSSGRPAREIFDALLGAAAWNLLNFDLAVDAATDNQIADNVSWLDFTHALTFANAARHLCEERPDLWPRALLQMALFVGRNAGYVAETNDAARWNVGDPRDFIKRETATLYDHGIVEPIIVCHRVKVLFALEDELAAAPDAPWTDTICAAVNRYLATPQKRRHSLRLATQARDFIAREG